MLNRLLNTIFFFALVASAAAQNPYLQGSLSGTGAPGTKTRSPLNSMERAANSLAGATILTDTFGNQRLALFVRVEDTCINYTPGTTGNTANLSAFVEKCGTDSIWYIDWTGRSVFLGSSGGSVCDEDWLKISDNSCPDTIIDSIYHYKYAAIGARLVWPTAEFLVSDSVGVGIQVISGSRNARLVFYDNNNVKYSTIDQSGASTIWYLQTAGTEWRIATAAGGTPENPTGPFVNQFAVNPPDSPLPTVQAHQYPNTRTDTNTIRNFIYTDGLGKFRSQAIDTLIQIIVDSIAGDTALQENWYTDDGTTTDALRTAIVDSAAQWIGDNIDGFFYFQMGSLGGGRLLMSTDTTRLFYSDLGGTNEVGIGPLGAKISTTTLDQTTITTPQINFVRTGSQTWNLQATTGTNITPNGQSIRIFNTGTNPYLRREHTSGVTAFFDRYAINSDSAEFGYALGNFYWQVLGTKFGLSCDEYIVTSADSVILNTTELVNSIKSINGQTVGGTLKRLQGTDEGDLIAWDDVSGHWEVRDGSGLNKNIYNTDDLLKDGGTTVGLDSGSLKFNLATTVANPYGLELTGSNTTTTNRFTSFKTEADSLRFQEFAGEYYMITNVDFQNNVSDQYRTLADSVQWIEGTVQTDDTIRYVLGMTPSGWMKRFDGNAATAGDVITSNGTDWVVSSPTALGYILQNGNSFGTAMTIGTNDNFALNLETNGTTGITLGTDQNLTFSAQTSATNSAPNRITIQTNSTGTATTGFGSSIFFQGESSTTDNRNMGKISTAWTTATDASRTSKFTLQLVNSAAALSTALDIFPDYFQVQGAGINYASSTITSSSNFTLQSSSTSSATAVLLQANGNNVNASGTIGSGNFTTTSGTKYDWRMTSSFSPTSGTGLFYNLRFSGGINQTGGANGLTGAIIFEPTLTAVGATWSALSMATSNSSAKFLNQTGANTTSTHVGAFGIGSTTVPADKLEVTGNVALLAAGNKLKIATGADASAGVSAAMTAGSITINTTAVTANSLIFLTHATLGGTQGILSVGTITAGTSFVINSSSATDTGTVNWLIIN